jgi:hypothetical protein
MRAQSRRRLNFALLLAPAALLLALAAPVAAWSALGHKLVGALAQRHLTPAAQAEVARLLAGEEDPTLAGVATWADTLRDREPGRFKATSPWHYVKFADNACQFATATCPDGQCVVGAIEAQRAILADRSQPDSARRDALKFLVHLVGDAHQPLHAGWREDKGGNAYQVSLATQLEPEAYARKHYADGVMGTNLHSVWDYYVLGEAGLGLEEYAAKLDRRTRIRQRTSGTPADWAAESCRLSDAPGLYPSQDGKDQHKLDGRYLDAQRSLAERRVVEAGDRLAALLNQTLVDPQ